jgi:hypothetical protein
MPTGGVEVQLYSLFNFGTRGWVVTATPRPLHRAEWLGAHGTGGWVDPKAVWTRKENLSPLGFDPRFVKPLARGYTDYATPALLFIGRKCKCYKGKHRSFASH